MSVRNYWSAAGWSRDFPPGQLTACTLLNDPIVRYRKSDSGLVAVQDRCCHRCAPLPIGRMEGDDVRCLSHGLKFAPSDKCDDGRPDANGSTRR